MDRLRAKKPIDILANAAKRFVRDLDMMPLYRPCRVPSLFTERMTRSKTDRKFFLKHAHHDYDVTAAVHVWNHPEEMEAYYNSHQKQFKFKEPCFKGMVLFCRSEKDYNNIKPVLDRNDVSVWVDSILAYNNGDVKIRLMRGSLETGIFQKGQNEYVDKIVFGVGEYEPMTGYPYINVAGRVLNQPDSMKDVAGEVAEEYQKYLENEWLKRLKSKYKYKIYKKALNKVSRSCGCADFNASIFVLIKSALSVPSRSSKAFS